MLTSVDIKLFQLEPQQILQASVCQGTFSETQAMDLNLHEILLYSDFLLFNAMVPPVLYS